MELLKLLKLLGCKNYVRALTTNLLILTWLKKVDHPAWKVLGLCLEAFNEEKGEIYNSFLATKSSQGTGTLESWQANVLTLPYVRKIMKMYAKNRPVWKRSSRKNITSQTSEVIVLINYFETFLIAVKDNSLRTYKRKSSKTIQSCSIRKENFSTNCTRKS